MYYNNASRPLPQVCCNAILVIPQYLFKYSHNNSCSELGMTSSPVISTLRATAVFFQMPLYTVLLPTFNGQIKWQVLTKHTHKPPNPTMWPNSTLYDVIIQSANSTWHPLDVVRYWRVCVTLCPHLLLFEGISWVRSSWPSHSSDVHLHTS